MITAMEINTKRFEQAKSGYNPTEVDDFLSIIADEIGRMNKEREDTEKKMEVLVESIRRYKADEEALKDALIGAQKQGRAVVEEATVKAEAIIAEAQQKAEQIIAAANVKADELIGTAGIRAEKAQADLETMQNAVSEFKSSILAMYKEHLALITSLPEADDDGEDGEASEEYSEEETAAVPDDMEATRVIDTSGVHL